MSRPLHRWFVLLAALALGATPRPAPEAPGQKFEPPKRPTAPGAPLIFEHSAEAGPDESFFLVGENLSTNLAAWGVSPTHPAGQEWKPRVQFLTNGYLAATLPERAPDGPFLVWLKNATGWSQPFLLNAPEPWWCTDTAVPGGNVRIFGRNLARRPDFSRVFVYLAQPGKPGIWLEDGTPGKYSVSCHIPSNLVPGDYEVWVHAGSGGDWGWGGPLKLRVRANHAQGSLASGDTSAGGGGSAISLRGSVTGLEIQQAMDTLAKRGGGTVSLPAGRFNFATTLRIPSGVRLSGKGKALTTLQLVHDSTVGLPRLGGSGWNQAPGAIHTPGDLMEYQLEVPKSGDWTVWLRYATDMAPWNQPGVSGNHALSVDDGVLVALTNLDNTGGFGMFKWSRSATLKLAAGAHKLTWKNVKGGGISLDAFVFALDSAFVPSQNPVPQNSPTVLVLQGEDCVRFVTKEGSLPGGDHAAVWICGDNAGVQNLGILGDARVNLGVAIRATKPLTWLTNCTVSQVRVADCDGKQGENCGLHVQQADHASIVQNELWGRAPLFISGAKQSAFQDNRLVSVTRFGGNAEAAILGRTDTIEECIIERNLIASPSGAEAGGPTARRLLWFSTGHGSITHNWIAGNGVEKPNGPGAEIGAGQARFGGVAGTDQNVGEMILFEGNHRTMFFGPLAGADAPSVTLPKTIPATPDNRLGSVERKSLAHDAAGQETPYWPPDFDDGTEEPPISEYYVTVFSGRGQGQTRRVVRREGERLLLNRPWTVPPQTGCLVAVGTMFYQNHLVGNYAADGMTGIQLWISCVENVVAGNTIARQRKPALYLYANGTTLASSMPRTWNRGLSPLFWNLAEGNRAEECSAGALVTSGESDRLPIDFPRALGNVIRHNSFIRNRTDGVVLTSRGSPAGSPDGATAIAGTLVEFNVVRDATVAYHASHGCDATLFRRNHAYFWYPVNNSTNAPVAFAVDVPGTTVTMEQNSIEGIHGDHDSRVQPLRLPPVAR